MSSFGSPIEPWDTGPGQSLDDEYEANEYRVDELEMLLSDIESVLESMEKSDDMPEQDAHRMELESLHDQIKATV
jgi:hypothetical protein